MLLFSILNFDARRVRLRTTKSKRKDRRGDENDDTEVCKPTSLVETAVDELVNAISARSTLRNIRGNTEEGRVAEATAVQRTLHLAEEAPDVIDKLLHQRLLLNAHLTHDCGIGMRDHGLKAVLVGVGDGNFLAVEVDRDENCLQLLWIIGKATWVDSFKLLDSDESVSTSV